MAHPLATYLARKKLTHAAFAEKIDVGRTVVTKVINGTRAFAPEVAQRVEQVTHGEVTLEQALNLPPKRGTRRTAA